MVGAVVRRRRLLSRATQTVVSSRELVVLGTASQAPTRYRNHNGYFLRWDDTGILFDPGEGTQRQMNLAGIAASAIDRICVTHLHGDHCLGLPGVVQRLSLEAVSHPVDLYFPAAGRPYIDRLLTASVFVPRAQIRLHEVAETGTVEQGPPFALRAARLDHVPDTFGWRIQEPAGHTMVPQLLQAAGIAGPTIAELRRHGSIVGAGGRRVHIEEVSVPRPGQAVAFVMDTGLCNNAFDLARGVDLLICEATFASADADLAARYHHLTAAQAGQIAARSAVGTLVITHFSQRYRRVEELVDEARAVFPHTVGAEDLMRVPLPTRRRSLEHPGDAPTGALAT